MTEQKTDRQKFLVLRLKEGNRTAFHKLYEFYHQDIYAFSLSLVKSKPLAEDIVQEVFLKVWLNRERLNPDLSFRSFVFTMARNLAFNTLAKAANNTKLRESVFYESQKRENTTDHKLLESNYEKLKQRAIGELSPRCKQVFQMSRNEGKTYEEISQELGVSKNTIKNQMSTALTTIRSFLEKHGDIVFLIFFTMEFF